MAMLWWLIYSFAFFPCLADSLSTSNPQISILGKDYTQFDLFKNTGLQPCPVTDNTNAQHANKKFLARSPRGGHGGGGSGGSGTYDSTPSFINQGTVVDQAAFCDKLANGTTPIVIPTVPKPTAFIPWWPSYLIQFVSLCVTYAGLWWTWRGLQKSGDADMKLPKTFWIQLPFDVAREIVWFIKTINGFLNPKSFAWVSFILWLLPFNYIWLIQLFDSKQRETRNQGPLYEMNEIRIPTTNQSKSPKYVTVNTAEYNPGQQGPLALANPKSHSKKLLIISIVVGLVAVAQFILTVFSVVHLWHDVGSLQTYYEVPSAVSNPSSIAPSMPATCLAWLESSTGGVTNVPELLASNDNAIVHVSLSLYQFAICTIVFVIKIWTWVSALPRSRRSNGAAITQSSRFRTWTMLHISAVATMATMGVSAFVIGIWVIVRVVQKQGFVDFQYTTNSTITGGCTFVFVPMENKWGYLDVTHGRAFRILLNILGAG